MKDNDDDDVLSHFHNDVHSNDDDDLCFVNQILI